MENEVPEERPAPTGLTQPPEPYDEEGNYDSPALGSLRRAWEDLGQGKISTEVMVGLITEVAQFIQVQLDILYQQVQQGVSNPNDPSFKLIWKGFETHLEAMEVMAREFPEASDTEDPEVEQAETEEAEADEVPLGGYFAQGMDLAQKGTNMMMAGHKLAMEHIDAIGRISCMFCGSENRRGVERCHHCGRALPALPGDPAQSSINVANVEGLEGQGPTGAEITDNFVIVNEAVAAWRGGALDADGLLAELEKVEGRLLAHDEANVQDLQLMEQQPGKEALAQAASLTAKAIQHSLEALAKMKLAFDKEDDSYLVTGLHDLEAASKLMVQSFHACREAAGHP
ncbi:MAG: hypothetical protein HY319_21780 [Armatimonadetes bacterium]|nr:hypothetical protein [Armatimonadota bacterium]